MIENKLKQKNLGVVETMAKKEHKEKQLVSLDADNKKWLDGLEKGKISPLINWLVHKVRTDAKLQEEYNKTTDIF